MTTAADFDRLYAEVLANRILLLQVFGQMADRPESLKTWSEQQRSMALQSIDLSGFKGYHNPEKIKQMTREAVNFVIDHFCLTQAQVDTLQ
ncbi:MAG: hypothetical protein ACYDD1_10640 [Caulobacteraceae bacterium]